MLLVGETAVTQLRDRYHKLFYRGKQAMGQPRSAKRQDSGHAKPS